MREKIIRIIFSIFSGFGIVILIFIGVMLLFVNGFGMKEESVFVIFGLIMGIIAFGVLSAKVYDYLKRILEAEIKK
ncbi:hypothetical protein COW77_01655 [Candidatus Wolfebacteria bacterium CG18_big_fil_WC_8_21_14_2_50_39_7]|uniref:Uncharacterized protein n=2 Tax=Candidatus Wolfeibacteriota TaxID=1752735 RepID=A0A2M8D8G9_9BACT|nr:hypothetical protein [Candidatus Wolfebacteria bacterium]PIP92125.1 MAG: hypothetical protein COW77_01655 [Candidatus Wolfebacteria bacterium CG18_big_fil_WC_8_21_14_2_50_39_7]PJB83449.1 MAG: hypothetical protein CO087_01740 [Candidatus Wolfebacteria bacterium CG_4_9_14_0_8_um_filter_39_46]